jgi:hypothetical protein
MIKSIGPNKLIDNGEFRINVNTAVEMSSRIPMLKKIGADENTIKLLDKFCTLDNKIWNFYLNQINH